MDASNAMPCLPISVFSKTLFGYYSSFFTAVIVIWATIIIILCSTRALRWDIPTVYAVDHPLILIYSSSSGELEKSNINNSNSSHSDHYHQWTGHSLDGRSRPNFKKNIYTRVDLVVFAFRYRLIKTSQINFNRNRELIQYILA